MSAPWWLMADDPDEIVSINWDGESALDSLVSEGWELANATDLPSGVYPEPTGDES